MVREFGPDVPKGRVYSINPALIIILVPIITAATSAVDPQAVAAGVDPADARIPVSIPRLGHPDVHPLDRPLVSGFRRPPTEGEFQRLHQRRSVGVVEGGGWNLEFHR